MKLGYIIIYVADVTSAVTFYQRAFGLTTRFVHESGDYAELDTGTTSLAFASHELGHANLSNGFTQLDNMTKPAGIEIALVTDDVPKAIENALSAGARLIAAATTKPWGQTVGYIQAPEGTLIELCTPVSA